jgi:hypothetical protein
MEDNLKKNKKNGRRPEEKKMEDDLNKMEGNMKKTKKNGRQH